MKQINETLEEFKCGEEIAESMVPVIGRLYRDRDVVVSVYGKSLARTSPVSIIKAHRAASQVSQRDLSIAKSWQVLQALSKLELDSGRIDLGRLTDLYFQSQPGQDLEEFLKNQLAGLLNGKGPVLDKPVDVVLYGFGRIGRLLARILVEHTGSGAKLRLRAIVLRPGSEGGIEKRASLFRRDSVHGAFSGTVTVDKEADQLIANGNRIQLIYAKSPEEVDYTSYGIADAVIVDNTGVWRDEEGLGRHLKAPGAKKVLLTAPGKGSIKNIIYGVNNNDIGDSDSIVSAASCTTNAIVPTLKLINDQYGIESAHLETVHAYTNDQNLIDNYHKKARRGRSAALNLVLTETGAASAVSKALPELDGKLTGNAIRVPTPNVSLAILNLDLEKATDVDEVNDFLRKASLQGPLRDQLDYTTSPEVVSTDIVGSRRAGIVDSHATIVNKSRCVLYVWYDNEAGYSHQVVRLAKQMAGLTYPTLPV